MAPKDPVHAVNNEEVCVSTASAALEFGDANLRACERQLSSLDKVFTLQAVSRRVKKEERRKLIAAYWLKQPEIAIAEVYNSEGDEEFRKKEYGSAIHFYTEGIKVNCNSKKLNTKLYSNRATAHNCLGNYNEALRDAKSSRELQSSCMKAFIAGAQVCVKVNQFEDAIAWIDDGLAIDSKNQTLLELKKESITKQCELLETNREKIKSVQTKMDKEGGSQSSLAFSPLNLDIAKKVGNRKKVGPHYLKLGNGFLELSHFQKAIDSYQQYLRICIEQEDKNGEGHAYGKLGNAYNSVGKVKEAMKYYELQLSTAKEVGDKLEEGRALSSLGNLFYSLGDFEKARENHELHLPIAIELGDRSGEGYAYGNLGNTFHKLGLCIEAMEYHEQNLKVVKELGDRVGEEKAYGNLGRVQRSLNDIERAIKYHELQRSIAKEEGMMADEACAYYELGCSVESQGSEIEALEYYKSSARLFEEIRAGLPCKQMNCFKDEWKINLFDVYQCVYTALCRIYLNQNMVLEALNAAEKGRAQALLDMMESHFGKNSDQILPCEQGETMSTYISSNTIFLGLDNKNINIWLLQPGQGIEFRRKSMENTDYRPIYSSLMKGIGVGARSCGALEAQVHRKPNSRSLEKGNLEDESPSSHLFDFVFGPIVTLLQGLQGDELIIVPEGSLFLVPFAVLTNPADRYLCELFKIRIAPSLTSLKMIADSPQGYHSDSGALLVGDPCVNKVMYRTRVQRLEPLPHAKEEVEMIGRITNIRPLTGPRATKEAVLQRLDHDALIHIATHASLEYGEIALAPNPKGPSRLPREEDYVLTMAEVLNVKVRAKLVVLSCCHTGQGEIRAEGVVGIARAFLAAGARSVLASLWAIDDEATLEFMKSFYQHLVEGCSSSKALNKAMKCLRESDKFSEPKYWAPFVLIGDDVTLDFLHKPCTTPETKIVEEHPPDAP